MLNADLYTSQFCVQFGLTGFTVHHYTLTGSSYICNPPVTTTDVDYIVLIDSLSDVSSILYRTPSWYPCAKYPMHTGMFTAYRTTDSNVNLIFTEDKSYYYRFLAATELAKKLNVTDKKQRIELFDLVINSKKEKFKPSPTDKWVISSYSCIDYN